MLALALGASRTGDTALSKKALNTALADLKLPPTDGSGISWRPALDAHDDQAFEFTSTSTAYRNVALVAAASGHADVALTAMSRATKRVSERDIHSLYYLASPPAALVLLEHKAIASDLFLPIFRVRNLLQLGRVDEALRVGNAAAAKLSVMNFSQLLLALAHHEPHIPADTLMQVVERRPKAHQADARWVAFRVALGAGRADMMSSIAELKTLLATHPESKRPYRRGARAWTDNDAARVVRLLEPIVPSLPAGPLLSKFAEALGKVGRHADAAALLDRKKAFVEQMHHERFRAALASKNPALARRLLDKLPNELWLQEVPRVFEAALTAGNRGLAKALLDAAIRQSALYHATPRNIRGWMWPKCGKLAARLGRDDLVEDLLRRKPVPYFDSADSILAAERARAGRWKDALALIDQAKGEPKVRAASAVARYMMKASRYDQAFEVLTAHVYDGWRSVAARGMVDAALKLGRPDEAARFVGHVKPEGLDALETVMKWLPALAKAGHGRAVVAVAANFPPEGASNLLERTAWLAAQAGRVDDALALVEAITDPVWKAIAMARVAGEADASASTSVR